VNCTRVALAFLFTGSLSIAAAQKIAVNRTSVMVDEVADVRVSGAQPGATVTIRADLVDGAGHSWQSDADFRADAQGTVDTATQAPVKGSYRIVSAMGLIWSMRSKDKDAHLYQPPRDFAPQTIHFHLLEDGSEVDTAQLVQLAIAAGIQQVHVQGTLHGTLFVPPGDGKHPGVLVLGGSEGGAPLRRAAWLASHGYVAFALAYFRAEGLPSELVNIPLEYFGQALAWISERPEVDGSRLAVIGASRGGELALQLGSMYPRIRAVVAYVPANVRHPACCGPGLGAAWTWQGQALAWAIPEVRPVEAEVLRAAIPLERTHGPILMIAAEDDGVWPSATMVTEAADRVHQNHFQYPCVVLKYPHAGHRAGLPEIIPTWSNGVMHPVSGKLTNFGGTPEGNAASSLDAIPKVLAFLEQSLPAAQKPETGEHRTDSGQQ
jgi:dienelactone hydrolase